MLLFSLELGLDEEESRGQLLSQSVSLGLEVSDDLALPLHLLPEVEHHAVALDTVQVRVGDDLGWLRWQMGLHTKFRALAAHLQI